MFTYNRNEIIFLLICSYYIFQSRKKSCHFFDMRMNMCYHIHGFTHRMDEHITPHPVVPKLPKLPDYGY